MSQVASRAKPGSGCKGFITDIFVDVITVGWQRMKEQFIQYNVNFIPRDVCEEDGGKWKRQ